MTTPPRTTPTLSPRPLLPTFLPSVNALLAALALPFALDHPTDLTPSLLLAIFESLIGARLPIPSSVRQSRTRDAKARAMLVLLGVLECDVLRGGTSDHSVAASNDSMLGGGGGVSVDGWVDEIGLGEVDPERLADGGWEETIFVGELLCWLARRKGILPKSSHRSSRARSLYSNHHSYGTEEGEGNTADFSTSLLLRPSSVQTQRSPRQPSIHGVDGDFSVLSHITDVPRHPLVHSPEPSISASATTGTDLSIRARSVSSRTSISNPRDDSDEFEEASQDTVRMYDPLRMMQDAEDDDDRPPTFRPRCIHELEDPSYIRALAGPSTPFDLGEHVLEDEDLSRDEDDADGYHIDEPYAPPTPTPRRIRLTGWIEPVDTAAELTHFAASRSHSRSHAFNTNAIGQSHSHKPEPTSPLHPPRSRTVAQPRTPRRLSPSPSPPPSPPPISSKHPPARAPPSPPPSPPSPNADLDPPFDVSFSTLNNTSTPAKPRPPRRPQRPSTTAPHETTITSGTGTGTGRRRRDRSPSYTPSPPSFTTRGSTSTGGISSARTPKTRASASATRKNAQSTSPEDKFPPPGSTATTHTLLTERARLLTELAALKRARAASGAGARAGLDVSAGAGNDGVVGRRVGVEVSYDR